MLLPSDQWANQLVDFFFPPPGFILTVTLINETVEVECLKSVFKTDTIMTNLFTFSDRHFMITLRDSFKCMIKK